MEPEHISITEQGDPRKPNGEAGAEMLRRMNDSHYAVTGWALEHFSFSPDDCVLDIGCGGGETLHRLASLVPEGKLFGADHSPVSIQQSSVRNQDLMQNGRLKLVEASVEALPYADNSFDKVITVESFYFWPDHAENLKEVRRVLRPGGTLLIVADIYGDAKLDEESKKSVEKYSLFNPTLAEFRQLLTSAGFSYVDIHTKPDTTWVCAEARK